MKREEVDRAFRAGLTGLAGWRDPGLAEAPVPFAAGPNEEAMLELRRLPGLAHPREAFEVGRVLRRIARLLDRAGAPARVGREFRDNLRAAAIARRSRPGAPPWTAADTVEMFVELYARVLPGTATELRRLRGHLLEERPAGLRRLFRRRRRLQRSSIRMA